MAADTRGFSYSLEPVRRRREWKLEAALAHLGNVHRQLAEKNAAGEALRELCVAQAQQAARNWTARADPVTKTRMIQYLASLHARNAETEREIATLRTELRIARERCASQQQALELIETHRAEMLALYATDRARKSSAHADADWISRDSQRSDGENSR